MTPQEEFHLQKIIGDSRVILKAKNIAKKAARTPSTVLITGDSGTGKELFAQAIHDMSIYSEGPLISVNCSAIPEGLLESELFGYEEGAFTDARKGGKMGKFELANKGTIFLDEIGDMPHFMQAKILRVLQDRTIEPVGGTRKRKVNVRIIAATNQNLEKMIEQGTFREDLYYRLNIIRLELPSLKERVEDIPKLMERFIEKYCNEFGFDQKVVSDSAMTLFMHYKWPGNVREVINVAEVLVSMTDENIITPEDLPKKFKITSNMEGIYSNGK
jgi:transcriptional regulator with PAS, ATPase and Fis domain